MQTGFEFVAAARKGTSVEDAPATVPMRGTTRGEIRRNPSTDQKKIRRQMAQQQRRTASQEEPTMTQHIEADLLAKMAAAGTLAEQREYAAQLETYRSSQRQAARAQSEVDFGASVVARMVPTAVAPSYQPHTAATDWLAETETSVPAEQIRQIEASARAEATVWYQRLDAGLKQIAPDEVAIQAQGIGSRTASQYGEAREFVLAAFVDQVAHLQSREGLGVQQAPYQTPPAKVDYSVKDDGSISDDAPSASGASDPKSAPGMTPSLTEGDSPEGASAQDNTEPAVNSTHDNSGGNKPAVDYLDGTSTPFPSGGETNKSLSSLRDEWGFSVTAEDQKSDQVSTPSLAEGGPVEGDAAQAPLEDQPGGLSTSDHVKDGGNAEATDSIDGTTYPKQGGLGEFAASLSGLVDEGGKPFLAALARFTGPADTFAGYSLGQVAGFLAAHVREATVVEALRQIEAGEVPDALKKQWNKGGSDKDGDNDGDSDSGSDDKDSDDSGSSSTCSVCGDKIARDPAGEDNRGWHHANGEKHDHEAKPGKSSAKTAGTYGGGSPKSGDTATCHADDQPIQFFDGAWYHLKNGPSHNDVYPANKSEREQQAKQSSRYDGTSGVPGSEATCKNCGGGLTAASGSGTWLHDKNGSMNCPGKDAPSETDPSFMDYVARPEKIREADGKGGWKQSALDPEFLRRVQASLSVQAADDGLHTYVCMWRGKRAEVKAKTTLEAQRKGAEQFGAKKTYEVDVMLAQKSDGTDVVHRAVN